MLVTSQPERVHIYAKDFDVSPKVMSELRDRTLPVAKDLHNRSQPDVVATELNKIPLQGSMPDVVAKALGTEHKRMDIRLTEESTSPFPRLDVTLSGRRGKTNITSLMSREEHASDHVFDIRRFPRKPLAPELITCGDMTLAVDELLPDQNHSISELAHPRRGLSYAQLAREVAQMLLPRASSQANELSYTAVDSSFYHPNDYYPAVLASVSEREIDARTLFMEFGARLVLRSVSSTAGSFWELARVSTTTPLQTGNDLVWKQVDYTFPIESTTIRPNARLALMSTTVDVPKLQDYFRKAWRNDNQRTPLHAALETLEETKLN